MKAALIGPVCKDINIIRGRHYVQPGGVTYYTGQALSCLGIETVVFCSHGPHDTGLLDAFRPRTVSIEAEGTIRFENEYPDENDYDNRVQRAEDHLNAVTPEHIRAHSFAGFDYIILGPLLHGNTPLELIESISQNTDAKLALSMQGMIRHIEGGKVVWKNPEKALSALKYVDYAFLDLEELRFIGQSDGVEASAKMMREHGAKNIVVTQGMHGSLIFQGSNPGSSMHKIRAFQPEPLVDPTGAGDSYMAGFIASQELQQALDNPKKQGEFAAMTATMSIENSGPFNGTREDVLQRLGWI